MFFITIMSVQQFCLRWNNHQPNFISVCSSLLHNGTLVDVTLAAEGRQLQAHKIVLSACSSYFQVSKTSKNYYNVSSQSKVLFVMHFIKIIMNLYDNSKVNPLETKNICKNEIFKFLNHVCLYS